MARRSTGISARSGSLRTSSRPRRGCSRSSPSTRCGGQSSNPEGASASFRSHAHRLGAVPLYLTEADIEALLTPADALEAIEACFQRMARGAIDNRPRYRHRLEEASFAVMSATDRELERAGIKSYVASARRARFVVALFDTAKSELLAVIEADKLGQLRTGAASGVGAKDRPKADAGTPRIIRRCPEAVSQ